jgi:hypothetical protein
MPEDQTPRVTRVVIDDLRSHPDGAMYLRSSQSALAWLRENPETVIDELWLDHDLGGLDTIREVVLYLEQLCFEGTPRMIGHIIVHTGNAVGGEWVMSSNLLKANYQMVRMTMPAPPRAPHGSR